MSRKPVQRTATRRGAKPQPRKSVRRAKRPSILDQAIAGLPFSQATLHRIVTWGIVAVAGAAGLGVASLFGVPGKVAVSAAEVVGDLGLRLDIVEPQGIKRLPKFEAYRAADDQLGQPMPLVDVAKVRARLLSNPWVQDARVSRRLPNTLRILIVERVPAAIWQNHGQLMLVDPSGVPLEPVSREAMPDLPLLIGESANAQEPARRQLLDAAPALKPLVKAATWVGNRRWDLIFDTGEKLQLPEGEVESAAALKKFAELDGQERLLGKGYLGFDMRDPDKMVVRRQGVVNPPPAPAATGV
jgi:cell division protein FtsQ